MKWRKQHAVFVEQLELEVGVSYNDCFKLVGLLKSQVVPYSETWRLETSYVKSYVEGCVWQKIFLETRAEPRPRIFVGQG